VTAERSARRRRCIQMSETKGQELGRIVGIWRTLGKRWNLHILKNLGSKEAARFIEIKNTLAGISSTMLSERLFELKREGLVEKSINHSKIKYRLPASAKELELILIELDKWYAKHNPMYEPMIAN
jgi:DNA-binding HxlR family transcriptional regulator